MSRRRAALVAISAVLAVWAGSAQGQQPGPVLVVGDSLEVGTGPQLKRELSGTAVTVDARTGRPSGEGLAVLRDAIRPGHRVVVFDLGTNDDPPRPGRLRSTLAAVRSVAGKRCLVVSTLVRPAVDGVSADRMNEVIEQFALATPTVRLADWAAAVQSTPGLLARDRVHATPNGYAERARVVAAAVRQCSEKGDEDLGPPPDVDDEPRGKAEALSPQLPPEPLLARLADLLPLKLPLGLLREARKVIDGALRQAEGSIVPIAPDAVLGREKDPLGKRSP